MRVICSRTRVVAIVLENLAVATAAYTLRTAPCTYFSMGAFRYWPFDSPSIQRRRYRIIFGAHFIPFINAGQEANSEGFVAEGSIRIPKEVQHRFALFVKRIPQSILQLDRKTRKQGNDYRQIHRREHMSRFLVANSLLCRIRSLHCNDPIIDHPLVCSNSFTPPAYFYTCCKADGKDS